MTGPSAAPSSHHCCCSISKGLVPLQLLLVQDLATAAPQLAVFAGCGDAMVSCKGSRRERRGRRGHTKSLPPTRDHRTYLRVPVPDAPKTAQDEATGLDSPRRDTPAPLSSSELVLRNRNNDLQSP